MTTNDSPTPKIEDCTSKTKHKHFKWTLLEDKKLSEIILSSKSINWSVIASKMKTRNARQCQERWEYYLSPNVNNSPWSPEEDALLIQKYSIIGSRWAEIARYFNRRTSANVKNRFLTLTRMAEKRMASPPRERVYLPTIFTFNNYMPQDFMRIIGSVPKTIEPQAFQNCNF